MTNIAKRSQSYMQGYVSRTALVKKGLIIVFKKPKISNLENLLIFSVTLCFLI
jgi:hypothetical protein